MTKTEAAVYLGVSTRAVERYAATGKLASHYERGKTGQVLAFDESELERFKAELEAPRPNVRQEASSDLARLDATPNAAAIEVLATEVLARLMEAAQGSAPSPDKSRLSVPVESKLLLTLAEAQALTGLSRGVLRAAIAAGDLKARQIGRAFRVKRGDLESYVKKL
jgi:excisionase family DNA binding protein